MFEEIYHNDIPNNAPLIGHKIEPINNKELKHPGIIYFISNAVGHFIESRIISALNLDELMKIILITLSK